MTSNITRLAAVTAAILSASCSGGGDGGSNLAPNREGKLSVSLIDAPIADAAAIVVEIDTLRVKRAQGAVLEFAYDPPLTVDLLELTPDNAESLLAGEPVPAGGYEWIELDVNADFDGVRDSFVTTVNGAEEELRVPSGSVRLVSGFTVTADEETRFVVDWDVRKGLVRPPGQPGPMLRPAFRVIDMTEYGTLTVRVSAEAVADPASGCDADAPDLDIGNVAYVFDGHGVEPDDIDEADPEPIATMRAEQGPEGPYERSSPLSPGDYTVAFTCRAGDDDPEDDDAIEFLFAADVTIEDGGEHVVEHP